MDNGIALPLTVEFAFSRKSFFDNSKAMLAVALRPNTKQLRNYGIAAVIASALAIWHYFENGRTFSGLAFIAGLFIAIELYLAVARIVFRRKYETSVHTMAEDIELRKPHCTWTLSDETFGYRDLDLEYEVTWDTYSGWTVYGKTLILWRRDTPANVMALDLEHPSLTKALSDRILAIVQSKTPHKPVK